MRAKCCLAIIAFVIVHFQTPLLSQECNWQVLDSTKQLRYYDISCSGAGECVAIGRNLDRGSAFIMLSDEEGSPWRLLSVDSILTQLNLPFVDGWYSVARPTSAHIFAFGEGGHGLVSTDSGIRWRHVKVDDDVVDLVMLDTNTGLAATVHGLVTTVDGWRNSNTTDLASRFNPAFVSEIAFSDDDVIYVTLNDRGAYFLSKSFDGGKTWDSVARPRSLDARFTDRLNGWLVTSIDLDSTDNLGDRIYRTTNGGSDWRAVLDTIISPQSGLQAVSIFEKQLIAATGGGRKLALSTDGGSSWKYCTTLARDLSIGVTHSAFDSRGDLYMASGLPESSIVRVRVGTSAIKEPVRPTPMTSILDVSIAPNQVAWYSIICVRVSHAGKICLTISDVQGRVIQHIANLMTDEQGCFTDELRLNDLDEGSYLVHAECDGIGKSVQLRIIR